MRYFLPILGLLLLIAGLAGVKFAQISSLIEFGKAMAASGPPPETVATDKARELVWEGKLSAVGSVVAEHGVSVSNDQPGVVTRIHFDSGDTVKKGQILVELDTSVERAQLASAQARLALANQNVGRTRSLASSKTVTLAKVDADEAQYKTSQTEVSQLQAQIDRKVVRAAFTGRLGIRQVNLGQYLSPGTTLTTLEALSSVFVDFALPQQSLHDLKNGMPVHISVSGTEATTAEGVIAAIDPSIDPSTRSIKVRASFPNPGEKLRPGMFVDVAVGLPQQGSIVAIPATSVVHASYGDSVFVIETPQGDEAKNLPAGAPVKIARQHFVRLGESRGDFVAVLDGVKAGQEVVSAGAFKLRNNAHVIVNNAVQPKASVNPTPENR
ncbi:MAG: putative Co/Zn/Cd efflux system rane fusion protein [Myxococcaceae bacterium]|nr:putative Co/Zn/Cd efflux system rane fusion protein [Myxococcaceae bacterium]